eukprot:TRINITY_DN846_c0_g2_i3.p1 TRINITY_DN846_c0_g2~~TRINITY_DN846_c0_g2_i3.p1  ORF type:complete len:130 (+),score=0.13 TRINITY_DN846_c0_g2_i3:725-1114(+)
MVMLNSLIVDNTMQYILCFKLWKDCIAINGFLSGLPYPHLLFPSPPACGAPLTSLHIRSCILLDFQVVQSATSKAKKQKRNSQSMQVRHKGTTAAQCKVWQRATCMYVGMYAGHDAVRRDGGSEQRVRR